MRLCDHHEQRGTGGTDRNLFYYPRLGIAGTGFHRRGMNRRASKHYLSESLDLRASPTCRTIIPEGFYIVVRLHHTIETFLTRRQFDTWGVRRVERKHPGPRCRKTGERYSSDATRSRDSYRASYFEHRHVFFAGKLSSRYRTI
jgi:hypothetical protein